jgi:diguanylate cyclase (GGDEF)-like protein
MAGMPEDAFARLAAEVREAAWELSLECVEEGLRNDTVPSLARLGRLGQLGDVPTFIAELANELADPQPERLRRGSQLAARVRDHAREREALGFAPREIVTEFLLLRRVLWRFLTQRASELESTALLELERRLNDAIDTLVAECVVAYFDRATSELAHQARHDPLTGLMNHQTLTRELELELERARRYGHGLALVFFDVDDFKSVNDTRGHPEGDRVLRAVAQLLRASLRASDLAGRMGGDEFAAVLVQSDEEAAGVFLQRLLDVFDEQAAAGRLPPGFSVSLGVAQYPSDGRDAERLFHVADTRMYEVKRSRGG